MAFISMFMAPVPSGNRAAYLDHASKAAEIFKDLGALEVVETWGVDVPPGEVTSMPMAVKLQDDETVVIGWIRWPSQEVANEAWAKMETDPRMAELAEMPFDGKRMIMGGFDVMLEV
ncbi:MAG: DUF1428 domain-containing protein [Pseudomonadota bacterium]